MSAYISEQLLSLREPDALAIHNGDDLQFTAQRRHIASQCGEAIILSAC
ncbi:MAG: hypothetical protein KF893_03100 [Caldilineaceae bacterium]|nr:hypothetical protein [Caldilineaceae bacterium]